MPLSENRMFGLNVGFWIQGESATSLTILDTHYAFSGAEGTDASRLFTVFVTVLVFSHL